MNILKEKSEKGPKRKLVIITGTTGKLGAAYLDYFKAKEDFQCLTIIRREPIKREKNVNYFFANLLNKNEVKGTLRDINFKFYSEIVFIHPIGMFKFEKYGSPLVDYNKDGIDDEIFASNVTTFLNVFSIIKEKIKRENKNARLIVFAFGSITDNYNIPFWQSYSKSKNYLRKIIKQSLNEKKFHIRSIFVDVSTVNTGNEKNLRPCANREYWLSPSEIVDISLKFISKKDKWIETSIYKHHPNFNPTWYTNHENVLERWEEQMGINQNKIKGGEFK